MESESPYRPPLTVEERSEPRAPKRIRWVGFSHLVMAVALSGASAPLLIFLSEEPESDSERNLDRVHFLLSSGVVISVMVLLLAISGCCLLANRKRGIKWSDPLKFFGILVPLCFAVFSGLSFLHGKMGPLPVLGPFVPLLYAVVVGKILGSQRVRDWVSPPRETEPGLGRKPWVKWMKD